MVCVKCKYNKLKEQNNLITRAFNDSVAFTAVQKGQCTRAKKKSSMKKGNDASMAFECAWKYNTTCSKGGKLTCTYNGCACIHRWCTRPDHNSHAMWVLHKANKCTLQPPKLDCSNGRSYTNVAKTSMVSPSSCNSEVTVQAFHSVLENANMDVDLGAQLTANLVVLKS